MKPLSLDLQNARTFDSLHYDFTEGVTAITGPNGAGKSTLASAVDVALFCAKGELADWLSTDRPEQTMTITLTFEHAGETYRVRRTFNGKGRRTTKVDLELLDQSLDENPDPERIIAYREWNKWEPLTRESASATQEELERIIGLNRDTFRASAYLAQGQASVFCESTPGRRKEILASVLGLQVWDGYRETARAELKAAEQHLAVVRSKIESAETELAERPGLELLLFQAQENEQAARSALAESESQLANARERLSKLREAAGLREAAERAAATATASLASLSDRIAALDRQILADEARLAEKPGLEVVAEGLAGLEREQENLAEWAQAFAERRRLADERNGLNARQARIYEQIQGLNRKVAQAQDSTTTTDCDRCGRPLLDEFAARAAESYEREIDVLTAGKDGLEETGAAIRLAERMMTALPDTEPDPKRMADVADLIRLGQEAQRSLAALEEVGNHKNAAERERDQMRAELPEREEAVGAATAQLEALGSHDHAELTRGEMEVGRLDMAGREQRRTLDGILAEIARLEDRLLRLDRIASEHAGYQSERDRLQQDVELLGHLDRACGPNGVPALILETSAIPQLEAEWNRLLGLLPTDSGDTFEVELHTQRERKTGDGAVDALDVIVYANGHARPYATYSGGEQMRISIAQRRALSNLLAHRKGADCPLMILDEPNSLDDQGMAALARVLQDLAAAENLTVLVVSHDPALRDAFEQTVEIEKVAGRSRIVGVESAVMEMT